MPICKGQACKLAFELNSPKNGVWGQEWQLPAVTARALRGDSCAPALLRQTNLGHWGRTLLSSWARGGHSPRATLAPPPSQDLPRFLVPWRPPCPGGHPRSIPCPSVSPVCRSGATACRHLSLLSLPGHPSSFSPCALSCPPAPGRCVNGRPAAACGQSQLPPPSVAHLLEMVSVF